MRLTESLETKRHYFEDIDSEDRDAVLDQNSQM